MFASLPSDLPQRFSFVLTPRFSLIAFASAIEPLRLANRLSGKELYAWDLISETGSPVEASNGLPLTCSASFQTCSSQSVLVVCTGLDVQQVTEPSLLSWLRRMSRNGQPIGAICTGAHILASAGLLEGKRCTLHWENIPAFIETFPEIEVTSEIFEIDGNRFTCSGGTGALDLMLHLISLQHGHQLAAEVADQFIHERIRDEHDQQRISLAQRLGVRHPKLLAVIKLMEDHIEEPLDRSDLAEQAGLSTRQLERLFRKYVSRSPARYYLELRLHRSRLLLLQTDMAVIDVALACGFVSASHFSKCYRDFFGKTPRKERMLVG